MGLMPGHGSLRNQYPDSEDTRIYTMPAIYGDFTQSANGRYLNSGRGDGGTTDQSEVWQYEVQ